MGRTNKSSFIKISRKILSWGWYKETNTKVVFLHLLLMANFGETSYKGMTIKRGQLVTGRKQLSEEVGLSQQQVRTALNHLKSTNEITIKTLPKGSIITVNNYDVYQNRPSKSTSNQPATNQQSTSNQPLNKKDKESKERKERERELSQLSQPLGEFQNVFLSQEELAQLKEKYPYEYKAKIERLSTYLKTSGKSYANHFAVILNWLKTDVKPKLAKTNSAASYDIDELEKIV